VDCLSDELKEWALDMTYRPYAAIIAEAQASNSNLTAQMKNQSGSTIAALTPVAIDDNGYITTIDVSDEDTIFSIAGVTQAAIADNATGTVSLAGRIENVSLPFAHGDYVYVSKTGGLTNQHPAIGVNGFVAGDAVIRVGVIVRNTNTPSNKDLLVKMQLVGKL
jgi:hypothetical protein